jgi:flavin reductase (DIM6/NTAB) family NADH-FMN oxidoreductase RutF
VSGFDRTTTENNHVVSGSPAARLRVFKAWLENRTALSSLPAMKRSLGAKTLVYPTPVFVVGTYDPSGKANVMTASWAGICCSQPPCVAVSLRRATRTHGNITARKAFTISIPSEKYVKYADYIGMVSGRDTDKFAKTALTPVKGDFVDAPYVKEFPLILECKLAHTFDLGIHTQFVGEIVDVKADEVVLGNDELPDIKKLNPIMFAPGAQAYYGIGGFLGQAFSVGEKL